MCASYPPHLKIIVGEKASGKRFSWAETVKEHHFYRAKQARARGRFVVPVLVVNGRNVCRSGTLSVSGEAALASAKQKLSGFFNKPSRRMSTPAPSSSKNAEESMVGRNREWDMALLDELQVGSIFDLMRENKKVKFGMAVASSERADSLNRYAKFKLCGCPFPGTEAFVNFSKTENADCPVQWHVGNGEDAVCYIHPACNFENYGKWLQYTSWTLAELSSNYLRLFLHQLTEKEPLRLSDSKLVVGAPPGVHQRGSHHFESAPVLANVLEKGAGILIHCISGWDRTPCFITWIRAIAWAEGRAHQSLDSTEFLLLTLGFDWALFRHRLYDRMLRREEIMVFAFFFLNYIALNQDLTLGGDGVDWNLRKERLLRLQSSFMKLWREALEKSEFLDGRV